MFVKERLIALGALLVISVSPLHQLFGLATSWLTAAGCVLLAGVILADSIRSHIANPFQGAPTK